jgi:hypothetical protein
VRAFDGDTLKGTEYYPELAVNDMFGVGLRAISTLTRAVESLIFPLSMSGL